MPETNLPPNLALMQMAASYRISQVLYVTARLGLADLLKEKPKCSGELAAECRVSHSALTRLLRALVYFEILTQDQVGRFTLTSSGVYLQSDHPNSVHPYILYVVDPVVWESWGNFIYSVSTGETAIKRTFGLELFEYTAQHPRFEEIFDNGMANMTASMSEALIEAYDFSQVNRVVDIGGGNGMLLKDLLLAYPNLQGILFDQPQVVVKAKTSKTEVTFGKRLKTEAGSFFKEVPESGDIYILKYILHDWDDEKAVEILKNCHRVMRAGARLLVVETLLPEIEIMGSNDLSLSKIFMDLQMLALTGGQERTETQYQHLLKLAGFTLTRVIPLPGSSNLYIIEGKTD